MQTSYETALAAVFIEGWIFILLSVTGARAKLIEYVPRSIALSMSAGIGMFLAFVGLQSEEGLGVSVLDTSTLVSLGERDPPFLLLSCSSVFCPAIDIGKKGLSACECISVRYMRLHPCTYPHAPIHTCTQTCSELTIQVRALRPSCLL